MPGDEEKKTEAEKKKKKETRLEAIARLLFGSSTDKGEGKGAVEGSKEPPIGRGGKYIE